MASDFSSIPIIGNLPSNFHDHNSLYFDSFQTLNSIRIIYSCFHIFSLFNHDADISPLVAKSDDPKMAEDPGVLDVVTQLDKACTEAGFFYVV